MFFNSAPFLFFFFAVSVSYFLCPHPWRWALLLAASCVFYMWFFPPYLLVLLLMIIINFWAGLWIEGARLKNRNAKPYLVLSIILTCSFLFVFKYFNLSMLNWIIPVGLTFHVMQNLSYVIEVYRGRQRAERHGGIYALYVMFFPQLAAGPLEKSYRLIPQFHERHEVDYQRIADGLKLMAWGLFKKVVIADRLAVLVDEVFRDVPSHQGPQFIVAALFFMVQLYCDFSGYCDMAVGAAKVLGFRLPDNFNFPLFSTSAAEWWRRWSVTYAQWLKDYVYLPLGGHRCPAWRWCLNIIVVFVISALGQRSSPTLMVWGVLNGLYVIMSPGRKSGLKSSVFVRTAQVFLTLALVGFSNIFLRARDMADALFIVGHLGRGWGKGAWAESYRSFGFNIKWWVLSIELIIALIFLELLLQNTGGHFIFAKDRPWVRWAYYYGLVLSILFWGDHGQNPFYYFQF